MKFVQKLMTGNDGREVYLLRTSDIACREAFYVLVVKDEMKEEFLSLAPDAPVNLDDYGTIIASGFGHTVPEETKARLRAIYKIEVEDQV